MGILQKFGQNLSIFISTLAITLSSSASAGPRSRASAELEFWTQGQARYSQQAVLASISSPNTTNGSVIASPSQYRPNYFYHWVRDSSLVLDILVRDLKGVQAPIRNTYLRHIWDYVDFSKRNQLAPNRSGGLGEPKFEVNGSAYLGDWNRPQNDGPALRAITLIRFAKILIAEGKTEQVRAKLYDIPLPAVTVIKADLEFVSHHWREPCFDLWEETYGQHFYTRIVQRRALLDGADLAELLGDPTAAAWYRLNAKLLESTIRAHWDPALKYLRATMDRQNMHYKSSDLDVAIILGALHAEGADDFYRVTDGQVLSTALALRNAFRDLYAINVIDANVGIGLGRYPEDQYDGDGVTEGNPWFLSTAALAELYYRVARRWREQGQIVVTPNNLAFVSELTTQPIQVGGVYPSGTLIFTEMLRNLRSEGDRYLSIIRVHAAPSGAMSEQFNRYTGFMQGAAELTWSHASFLTAVRERSAK